MKLRSRMLTVLLASILLLSGTVGLFVLSGFADGDNIASDKAVTVKAFDTAELASHTARQFTEGTPVGIRMGFGAPFHKLTLCMPTWGDKTVCLTLSLYKWDTDFDTTRTAPPVASRRIENHPDNGHAALSFDEQPAGEYLICVDEFSGGRLGAWQMSAAVSNAYTYESGVEKAASWEISVSFTKTPVEPFRKIESAKDAIDGKHTAPAEWEMPADHLVNTHKVMPDTWVFTDGLGRESVTYEDVGGVKEDRTVAMFYWTWHVDLAFTQPLNVNDFMLKYPEAIRDYDHEAWPKGGGTAYFWNEPLYGYYRTNDPWVLRRHAELLANAGVDTIFTDNTNGAYTWKSSYGPLMETWNDAQENGAVDVPKVSFLLPFGPTDGSREQIEMLYLDIFRPEKYQNLWFYWDEKPMLMGYNGNVSTSSNLHKEIKSFFTWRPGQPAYVIKGRQLGTWGWLAAYPQTVYYKNVQGFKDKIIEQMTVGVAVNHNYETNKGTAMNGVNVIGRSYTPEFEDRYEKEGTEATKWGYQFAKQFDYALEQDPQVLFITGWNEWTAGRHESWGGVENAFPDQFIDEYSRDLEMTRGELKDHYYYLLVNYVRKYKGVNPIPTPSPAQTIDLSKSADQWSTAEPYYAAYIGNTAHRDAQGYGNLRYTETSGRNDIIGARVARDADTVWFFVECFDTITPYTDSLWMNLYIDSDQESKGWETFDFVVNKSAASADTLVLERFTGNGYDTEKVADVKYRVDGKTMAVEIPKSALGLEGNDFTLNFAWTDNVHDEGDYTKFSGDILDFYLSGDVAPGARFKFSYISTHENTTGETETEAPTEAPTAEPTEPAVTDPAETPTESPSESVDDEVTEPAIQKGCKSSLLASAALLSVMAAAVALCKKED